MAVITRALGRSGIDVGALGMGCWAIGGPWSEGSRPLGWGVVDDEESIRAVRRALELGVTLRHRGHVRGGARRAGPRPGAGRPARRGARGRPPGRTPPRRTCAGR